MRGAAFASAVLLSGTAGLVAADCAADNCLRAMRATQSPGRLASARAFCATFATASVAASAMPTYAAENCKQNQNGDLRSRVSSACACIAATTTMAPTTTPPSTPTTSATATTSTLTTVTTPSTTVVATGACALVSSSWSAQIKATPTPLVAASLAHDCLNSIPLNKTAAIDLVDALIPFIDWQSDVNYKKTPPPGYFYPGYDIYAALAKVRANLVADKYANEYEFQQDMYITSFGPAHDGHFVFYADALTKVFEWRRQLPLVSISEDGKSLPVIKAYDDVIASPSTASSIVLINGIPAAKYVADTIDTAGFCQDVDSNYNSMFWGKAGFAAGSGTGYFSKGGRIRYIYQGANTTFVFANGTILTQENKAAVKANMSGVTDGAAYYAKFCIPKASTGIIEDGVAAPAAPAAPVMSKVDITGNSTVLPGYPKPVLSTGDGVVSGYYLDGAGFESVAVIVLTSFENDDPVLFQAAVSDFFAKAKADGKTKLVIDFQANGGGYILLGYDFFRQLFPKVLEDGFSRWRANDAFTGVARVVSDQVANIDPRTNANSTLIDWWESWFNYRYDLNETYQNFTTFDAKFAPHVYQNTPYTANMRWNLSDSLTTTNESFGLGMEISGYGTRANLTQPFAAEDIVMLYDGLCASTCTLASEMLRLQGGVKSVAFGGRPIVGPIQGVGGVKGAQVLQFSSIRSYAQRALRLGGAAAATDAERAALGKITTLPELRSSAASVNARDQILRPNLVDGIPAQFIAENADCRLYWTAPMITDVSAVWKAAADAAFNGAKCAYGGITHSRKTKDRRRALPLSPSVPTVAEDEQSTVVRRQSAADRTRSPFLQQDWEDLHLLKVVE